MDVREFRASDGAAVRAFWESSGLRIRPGDDDASLAAFAERNPGLFLLALDGSGLAATALGGWKVNLIVWDDNAAAMDFWIAAGYRRAATVEFEKEL